MQAASVQLPKFSLTPRNRQILANYHECVKKFPGRALEFYIEATKNLGIQAAKRDLVTSFDREQGPWIFFDNSADEMHAQYLQMLKGTGQSEAEEKSSEGQSATVIPAAAEARPTTAPAQAPQTGNSEPVSKPTLHVESIRPAGTAGTKRYYALADFASLPPIFHHYLALRWRLQPAHLAQVFGWNQSKLAELEDDLAKVADELVTSPLESGGPMLAFPRLSQLATDAGIRWPLGDEDAQAQLALAERRARDLPTLADGTIRGEINHIAQRTAPAGTLEPEEDPNIGHRDHPAPDDDDSCDSRGGDGTPQHPSDVAKRKLTVPYYLDKQQYAALSRLLPHKKIKVGSVMKSHPVTRIIKEHIDDLMWDRAVQRAGGKVILDIGGDAAWHAREDHQNVHVMAPANDAEDIHRVLRAKARGGDRVPSCRHMAQVCNCVDTSRVGAIYMSHSIHYFTPEQMLAIGERYKVPIYASLFNIPDVEGHALNSEMTWRTSMAAGDRMAWFHFQPANEYCHSACDWVHNKVYRGGTSALHTTLEVQVDTMCFYEILVGAPYPVEAVELATTLELRDLMRPELYANHPYTLRPLSLSFGVDTATVSVPNSVVSINTVEYYSLGGILAIAAPGTANSNLLLPKQAIGEVAVKLAGKVRDKNARDTAYAFARAAVSKLNVQSTRLAHMVPYVATLGLYLTIENELQAELAAAESRSRSRLLDRIVDPSTAVVYDGLAGFIPSAYRKLRDTPGTTWALVALTGLMAMVASIKAGFILLRVLLRSAMGSRMLLLRVREALGRLPWVGGFFHHLMRPTNIIRLREWAGNPRNRAADLAFLGYAYSAHPVAVGFQGMLAAASTTWVTMVMKPWLKQLGQWLVHRFAIKKVAALIIPKGFWAFGVIVTVLAPIGEEGLKRVFTRAALNSVSWATYGAHQLIVNVWPNKRVDSFAGDMCTALRVVNNWASKPSSIVRHSRAHRWANVVSGAAFGVWESHSARKETLIDMSLRVFAHSVFAYPLRFLHSCLLHGAYNGGIILGALLHMNGYTWTSHVNAMVPSWPFWSGVLETFGMRFIYNLSHLTMGKQMAHVVTSVLTIAQCCYETRRDTPPNAALWRFIATGFMKLYCLESYYRDPDLLNACLTHGASNFIVTHVDTVRNFVFPPPPPGLPPVPQLAAVAGGIVHHQMDQVTHDAYEYLKQMQAYAITMWHSWNWSSDRVRGFTDEHHAYSYSRTADLRPLRLPFVSAAVAPIVEEPGRRALAWVLRQALGTIMPPAVANVAVSTAHAYAETTGHLADFTYRALAHLALQCLPWHWAMLSHALHNAVVYWWTKPGRAIERNDVCWWPVLNLPKIRDWLAANPECKFRAVDLVDTCRPKIASRLLGPAALAAQPVVSRQCLTNHIVAVQERMMSERVVEGCNLPLAEAPKEVRAHYTKIWQFIAAKHTHILRPKTIQPTPRDVWLSRFPGPKRRRLAALMDEHTPITTDDMKIGMFDKVENIIGAFALAEGTLEDTCEACVAQKAPRPICGISDKESIETGPWVHAWFNEIKEQYGFRGPYCHASGMNAAKIGEWFDFHVNRLNDIHGRCHAVEIDCHVWDGHMIRPSIEIENKGLFCFWHPPRNTRTFLERDTEVNFKTKTGLSGKIVGIVASGRSTTSGRNGEFNIDNFGAAIMQILPDIRDHAKHLAYIVQGDDSYALVSPWLYEQLQQFNLREWFKKVNHDAKIFFHEDPELGSFCSGYFFPTIDPVTKNRVHVWGMKPGRALAKGMWRLNPNRSGGEREDLNWLRGVSIQYNFDCAHIPVLRAQRLWLERTVNDMWRAGMFRGDKPIFEQVQRPRSPRKYPCTQDTLEFMLKIWPTLTLGDIASVEKQIMECQGPTLLDSWAIREILKFDVGFKAPTLPELTIEWKGLCRPDPSGRPVAIRADSLESQPLNYRYKPAPFLSLLPVEPDSLDQSMSNAKPKSSKNTQLVRSNAASGKAAAAATRRVANAAAAAAAAAAVRSARKPARKAAPARPRKGNKGGNRAGGGVLNLGPQFEAQVKELMLRLAFPDRTTPPRLGMTDCALTAVHNLFYRFGAPWALANVGPASDIPYAELWIALFAKNPNCALIYPMFVNGTVSKQLCNDGATQIRINSSGAQTIQFDSVARTPNSANGNNIEPAFSSEDPDEIAPYAWVDCKDTSPSIMFVSTGQPFPANTTYSLNYVKRVGANYTTGVLTQITGGAASGTLTFTLSTAGYYSFYKPGSWTFAGGSLSELFNVTIITPLTSTSGNPAVAGGMSIIHEALPSKICSAMESLRINAARGIMTNFSAPLEREGGCVAYEAPSADRWDEFIYNAAAAPVSSIFATMANQDGAQIRDNEDGMSVASHPNITSEPIETQGLSGITANVQSTPAATPAVVPMSDLGGATFIVVRADPTSLEGRNGYWQIHWHTEGESGSQLYPKGPAEYSPLVIQEAEARFRNFRLVTGNPDHITRGINAIAGMFNRANKVGDAMIATGVGAPMGGSLKGLAGIGSAFMRSLK